MGVGGKGGVRFGKGSGIGGRSTESLEWIRLIRSVAMIDAPNRMKQPKMAFAPRRAESVPRSMARPMAAMASTAIVLPTLPKRMASTHLAAATKGGTLPLKVSNNALIANFSDISVGFANRIGPLDGAKLDIAIVAGRVAA